MNIKQAAEQSGVSARNIRYYEQAGLLTPARNPENEYRIYSQADVRALKLIRMLRTLDMPVEEIGTVLNGTLPLAGCRAPAPTAGGRAAKAGGGGRLLHGAGRRRPNGGRAGCGQLP